MFINKRAMLSNVYDICTVVAHLRVSHAQSHLRRQLIRLGPGGKQ